MKTLNNLKIATTLIIAIVFSTTSIAQSNIPSLQIATAIASNKIVVLGNKEISATQVDINLFTVLSNNFNSIEIERSFDNVHFNTAIKGTQNLFSNEVNNIVKITDASTLLNGKKLAFYRVKMIDNYGVVSYTNTTLVGLEG
jgi:hypothetical protein